MSEIAIIGLDLAKQVFQVYGVDSTGRAVLKRKLRRAEMAAFFANLPRCGGDGGLRNSPLLGPGDLHARPRYAASVPRAKGRRPRRASNTDARQMELLSARSECVRASDMRSDPVLEEPPVALDLPQCVAGAFAAQSPGHVVEPCNARSAQWDGRRRGRLTYVEIRQSFGVSRAPVARKIEGGLVPGITFSEGGAG